MEEKNQRIHMILYASFVLLLCLPFLRNHLWPEPQKPLYGYQPQKQEVFFGYDTWLDRSWSRSIAEQHATQFGFRNLLVRLHNQAGYSLFGHSYSNSVIPGKEGYLFDKLYIKAYTGEDFLGADTLRDYLNKLQAVQNALHSKGIELLFVFAPGKASYFPEYLPDETPPPSSLTNYSFLQKEMKERNIPHADFVKWFAQMKASSEYPLFPQCGIHWSYYGALLAHDSLNAQIGMLLETSLPRIVIDHVSLEDSLRPIDHDVGQGMNLLFEPKGYPCAYAEFHFRPEKYTPRHTLLTIGDSYYWTTEPWQFQGSVFHGVHFLYYNKELHSWDGTSPSEKTEDEIVQLSLRQDAIMLLSTDANLFRLSWGYVDIMYSNLAKIQQAPLRRITNDMINAMCSNIRKNPEWFSNVGLKAKEKNIPVDSMLRLDAIYMLEQSLKK